MRAGWDYLGDEAIGVRAGSLVAVAYPKPLSLDAAGRAAIGLDPVEWESVPPSEVRAGAVGLPGEVGPVDLVVPPGSRRGPSRCRSVWTRPRR